ncbi:MAG TPA: LuxR family transcriptional regulator [Gaiellaceae bacterium]|nr:LuxR family transcriptional regulator [Gaiellaceae bacterium]
MLVGREEELRRVTALLDEARRGRSGTMVVAGDPGVGKTALLAEARARSADLRVLAATGVESELELPFASLHELLRPVLELLPRIPPLQQQALSAALALEAGEPDAFVVGAATLSLLVEAAAEFAVLIVLDDAHWLDRASADALAFAARRLLGEEIAFLLAVRTGQVTPFDPLPRLDLRPLAPDDARRLLGHRGEPVAAADEARLLAASAGNPLVLLELPVELARWLPTSATPNERLRRAFSRRVEELPEAAQFCLLLAAAEPDVQTVRRASAALDLDDPLAPAEAAGLVRIEGKAIVFRHPVVRSLVYSDATDAARRQAHRALADALRGDEDLDRRAWHRAAAAEDVDEEIAAALEETAERAGGRGGHAAEARALERAARLSPRKLDLARRLYAAVKCTLWAGDTAHGLELAEEALRLNDDPLVRAELLVRIDDLADERLPEARILEAVDAGGLDSDGVAKLLNNVSKKRVDRWDVTGAVALAAAQEQHARRAGAWWGRRALAGAAAAYLVAGDRGHAEELYRELTVDPAVVANHAFEYLALELYDELRSALAESLRDGRATGNQMRICWNQVCAADLELRQGRLDSAIVAAAEAVHVGETIGQPTVAGFASAALAGVYAWRGQKEACVESARAASAAATALFDRLQEGFARQALALLALGAGRPYDAIVELEPIARAWAASTMVEPGFVTFVPDLVEAYAVSGATDEAAAWLARYAHIATEAGRTSALAACARCEGLLAAVEFDEPFNRAIELLEPSPLALDLARTQLAYGERLRRQGRRRDARMQLAAAHDAFVNAGATPWIDRSAAELRATGVQVADAAPQLPHLTPQELHIALQVADGKTNKEIAAALFLSTKTIEYHLANAYRKLDIHSRAELARIVSRDFDTTPGAIPVSAEN